MHIQTQNMSTSDASLKYLYTVVFYSANQSAVPLIYYPWTHMFIQHETELRQEGQNIGLRGGAGFIKSKFQCKDGKRKHAPGLRGGGSKRSSTGWKAGWVSGEEGNRGTPSGSCGASPWPTQSSGWSPPRWRRPPAGTGSSEWSRATSPAAGGGGRKMWTQVRTSRWQQHSSAMNVYFWLWVELSQSQTRNLPIRQLFSTTVPPGKPFVNKKNMLPRRCS